jgi:phosphoribosylformylglycinamidine synthase
VIQFDLIPPISGSAIAKIPNLIVDLNLDDWHFNETQDIDLDFDYAIEISPKLGVTDNKAMAVISSLELLQLKARARTGTLYFVKGNKPTAISCKSLFNPLIEDCQIFSKSELLSLSRFTNTKIPEFNLESQHEMSVIDLSLDTASLKDLFDKKTLALSVEEIEHIKNTFNDEKIKKDRQKYNLPEFPTLLEIEMIAQTWSEHCKHKIFNAQIEYTENPANTKALGAQKVNSIFKTFVKKTTDEVIADKKINWAKYLFKDNAGIVRFDSKIDLCLKVETHNSPSALDPFGGAMTGILGVNRDILGCGMGAKPIANTDIFCVGSPDVTRSELPEALLMPKDILSGIHKGICSGGNESGIPTVNGSIYFDEDYSGKPLVYCGTLGFLPQKLKSGANTYEKKIKDGDYIVMVGGRVGLDGIHGATFSSLDLNQTSPTSAVQIGDPFTQKRVIDFILKARDLELFSAITDNGAGGLSSSIGEMATLVEGAGGAKLNLSQVPLKYPGLAPHEILISESQERMSVSVNKKKWKSFLELSKEYHVESTIIGEFCNTGEVEIYFENKLWGKMSLYFLHESLPKMKLNAHWDGLYKRNPWRKNNIEKEKPSSVSLKDQILKVLSHPNVASKESWVKEYDHEVQGATMVKPYIDSAPSDAGVIWAYPHGGEENNCFLLSHGMAPKLNLTDPYLMAQFAIDEALRNLVATGADLNYLCALDNFCWPDSLPGTNNPDFSMKLAALVRSAIGMSDALRAYGVPLISGKDSMKNDYRFEKIKISILPTLLITMLSRTDIKNIVTTPFKKENENIFLVGDLTRELLHSVWSESYLTESNCPEINLEKNFLNYSFLQNAISLGYVSAAHDVSEGGLITTICEMMMGNNLGALLTNPLTNDQLFSESPGKIIISVPVDLSAKFIDLGAKQNATITKLGVTTNKTNLEMPNLNLSINEIKNAYNHLNQGRTLC